MTRNSKSAGLTRRKTGRLSSPERRQREEVTRRIAHSKVTCCGCGDKYYFHPASTMHPVGYVRCRVCDVPACKHCVLSDAPAIESVETDRVQVPANPAHRCTFGWVCCECGESWETAPEGAQPKQTFFGKLLGKTPRRQTSNGHAVMIDYRQQQCLKVTCRHVCCTNCIRFFLRDNNAAQEQTEAAIVQARKQEALTAAFGSVEAAQISAEALQMSFELRLNRESWNYRERQRAEGSQSSSSGAFQDL